MQNVPELIQEYLVEKKKILLCSVRIFLWSVQSWSCLAFDLQMSSKGLGLVSILSRLDDVLVRVGAVHPATLTGANTLNDRVPMWVSCRF